MWPELRELPFPSLRFHLSRAVDWTELGLACLFVPVSDAGSPAARPRTRVLLDICSHYVAHLVPFGWHNCFLAPCVALRERCSLSHLLTDHPVRDWNRSCLV